MNGKMKIKNKLINDCIIIENNIKEINLISDKIEKYNLNKELDFELKPGKDEINKIFEKITKFGNIKEIKSFKSQKIENKSYSYECTNISNLETYIYEGNEEIKIELDIKNNGILDWPENKTKLIFDNNSEIKSKEVILKPQKCGEEVKYEIEFKNLQNLKVGEYKIYLIFEVNEESIGEKLILKLIIKKKEELKDEINKYIDKIKEFREFFGLYGDEFSNEKLLEALKDKNFNYELAFESLFS